MAKAMYPQLSHYYLKKNIVLLITVVVVFVVGFFILDVYQQKAQTQTQTAQQALDQSLNRVIYLQRQLRLEKQYGPLYQQYDDQNLLARQDRVKWTDELLKIKQELLMVPFTMQFEPEEKAQANVFDQLKLMQPIFYSTQLNLTAGIQSDADVIRLFQRINQRISPMYFIKECHLKATPQEIKHAQFRTKRANMNLQCSLVLFLAKPRPFEIR